MISRKASATVIDALDRQAAVALIGPRQVGKTTLALAIAEDRPSLYLDLESSEDRNKLADPVLRGHDVVAGCLLWHNWEVEWRPYGNS